MTDGATFSVAIVGAGFGGLGMAIKLKQAGIDDFVVFERDGDVGGTWRDNTYPGLPVRHPVAPLLVLVRARTPSWTRTYPLQPEIREYLRRRRRATRRASTTSGFVHAVRRAELGRGRRASGGSRPPDGRLTAQRARRRAGRR